MFKSFLRSIGKHIALGAMEAIAQSIESGKPVTAGNIFPAGIDGIKTVAIEDGLNAVIKAVQTSQTGR